ncbi:Rim2p [Sugiyamaella lignohabitans]|uniref:Rim2p n=1 Tax=Sugiyamaella lignohabitans TaxID=796027 RepID=A0A167CWM0_9ASCO|nr:Rim2p [Sugiyamaella lignohabitans]ANB12191.1 Rim2p [Sugiyamaella lignohabitans]
MSMKDSHSAHPAASAINAVHRLNTPPVVEDMTSDENSSSIPVVPTLPRQKHRKVETAKVSPWLHFFAGGAGGMAGALFTSPLDVVKTRLQSDLYGSQYGSGGLKASGRSLGPIGRASRHVYETFHIIKSVYQVEGARSLFKGLGPNLVGVIPARSINFFTYGLGKDFISTTFNNGKEETWVHLGAAATAGIVTSTCTNPIWLVKTRLQLDKATKASGERQYKNSWDCIVKVVKHEGIAGLYRGLSASYLGVVESSLQWVLYEQMKGFIRRREQHRIDQGVPSTRWDSFLEWSATSGAAGAAKFMASLMTYPHEVVRTRLRQAPMQDGKPKYKGLINCFRIIIKEEGFLSMYGGLTPHLLRTVPNSIIMFGTWELIVRFFSK